jgi:hypothetical protein
LRGVPITLTDLPQDAAGLFNLVQPNVFDEIAKYAPLTGWDLVQLDVDLRGVDRAGGSILLTALARGRFLKVELQPHRNTDFETSAAIVEIAASSVGRIYGVPVAKRVQANCPGGVAAWAAIVVIAVPGEAEGTQLVLGSDADLDELHAGTGKFARFVWGTPAELLG